VKSLPSSVQRAASILALCACLGLAGPAASDPKPTRARWQTSRIHGTPDPPDPYEVRRVFPNVAFDEPLAISRIPETDLFIVAERRGRIFTFRNHPDAKPELLVDIGRNIYGVAAHPRFVDNGSIYVTSVVDGAPPETASRLSHVAVGAGRPRLLDPAAETVLLEWRAGGHNSGCVRFGPDGFLYLATGDASGWGDLQNTGQRIDDLLASILRIDVDRPSGSRPYSVPRDNPFVDAPGARPEVWSYGHRNVWKFSFDAQGRLWAGDVGADLWESIHLVERGGNYGWSLFEGSHPYRLDQKAGPTPRRTPIVEHPHSDFRSITGGYVHDSGGSHPLDDHYVYGDYDTGRIWGFKWENGAVAEHRQLADTRLRIVAFALGHAGDVYALDFVSGTLHALAPATPRSAVATPAFPRRLSETGLFESTEAHTPARGLIPYSVNAEAWADGAAAERYIALPGDSKIEIDGVTYPMPPPGWRFPDGAVLVQTLSLTTEPGNPAGLRRLETRILHHEQMPGSEQEYGAQVWRGYSYAWNEGQTDALLVPAEGRDLSVSIRDPSAPGGVRSQAWHVPGRAECMLCHTTAAKYVLGVNTPQMNRSRIYPGGIEFNQIAMLERRGVFTAAPPKPPRQLPRLADPYDATLPLERRARAYLDVNCSPCHRLWGGGNTGFQLQSGLPLSKTHTLGVAATRGTFGLTNAALISPGHPERSVLLERMKLTGFARMPRAGSSVVDPGGVALIDAWIRHLNE
jgi:uncharacterized repeat protein (TIGR03806 family)